jgi:ribonuclease HII
MKIRKQKYIIGIDEVGRGALAGPIAVAVLALPRNFQSSIKNFKLKLRDSKRLTLKQREEWFSFIKQQEISFIVANISPKIIDRINISQAANLAATRAFKKLAVSCSGLTAGSKIYLDGGLHIKSKIRKQKPENLKIKTIIKGDEKIPAVTLASIVAKVHRDRFMKRLHGKHPRYDFIHNVGYGTKKHIKAIRKFGLSPIHRKSFCKNFTKRVKV